MPPGEVDAGPGDRCSRRGAQPLTGRRGERDPHGGTAGLGAGRGTFLVHGDHPGKQRIEHRCLDDSDRHQFHQSHIQNQITTGS